MRLDPIRPDSWVDLGMKILEGLATGESREKICRSHGIMRHAYDNHLTILRAKTGRRSECGMVVVYLLHFVSAAQRRKLRMQYAYHIGRVSLLNAKLLQTLVTLTNKPEHYDLSLDELAVVLGLKRKLSLSARLEKIAKQLGIEGTDSTLRVKLTVVSTLVFLVDRNGRVKGFS